ncbi:hypothetical protein XI04_35585 [Bradyrhizobium sp. CCBAU 11430]|nr:hypothetical protein [Bradyrhizobium sp. CCBAU 21360]MDA9454646.1 hypothetical protein [Bradyrhizobium sp. CCBAU 21359]MDA9518330.1 hypothetical protein [Bradyrhizobium sp. CCBAU 11430]
MLPPLPPPEPSPALPLPPAAPLPPAPAPAPAPAPPAPAPPPPPAPPAPPPAPCATAAPTEAPASTAAVKIVRIVLRMLLLPEVTADQSRARPTVPTRVDVEELRRRRCWRCYRRSTSVHGRLDRLQCR